MGYWENTSYIAKDEIAVVAAAIEDVLTLEGMRRVPRPARRERMRYEPLQYEKALSNNTWALAVFPGVAGWTVIKTAPLELLAERATGHLQPRFVELCGQLGAAGFQLNVYDSDCSVLVETDGRGRMLLSGLAFSAPGNDPSRFHGEPLAEDRSEIRFEILPLQKHIADCHYPGSQYLDKDRVAATLARLVGGRNAQYCDNMTSVETLICHAPLTAADGLDLYFEWPARDRPEPPPRAHI
jgi:hypothetical protein